MGRNPKNTMGSLPVYTLDLSTGFDLYIYFGCQGTLLHGVWIYNCSLVAKESPAGKQAWFPRRPVEVAIAAALHMPCKCSNVHNKAVLGAFVRGEVRWAGKIMVEGVFRIHTHTRISISPDIHVLELTMGPTIDIDGR